MCRNIRKTDYSLNKNIRICFLQNGGHFIRTSLCDTNAWGQVSNGLISGPSHLVRSEWRRVMADQSLYNYRRAVRFHAISSLICGHLVTKGFHEFTESLEKLEENIYNFFISAMHADGQAQLGKNYDEVQFLYIHGTGNQRVSTFLLK